MAITAALPLHGGNLAAAEARWGIPEAGWLDLSTGINPWPYPIPRLAGRCWRRLPDAAREQALIAAARRHWSVPEGVEVVPAPGTQALIQALPRLLPSGSVAIVSPTYGEHARAWSAAGHDVTEVDGLDSLTTAQAALVVNPNNPDGRTHPPQALLDLAARMAAKGGFLVVDEAFGDAHPELSLAGRITPGLVVLRSFGKFFGLAGIRLGFALAEPGLAQRLGAMMGPWAVSGPALEIGIAALDDEAWGIATRARLHAASARLAVLLQNAGLEVVGGTTLFQLACHPDSAVLYDRLGRAGILVRAFAARPDWLRFGLPGSKRDEWRLRNALG
ncbi:Threonine-phosphate decarboxylase [Candidatus Terasakiella magnetica]|nr:Threonine-phosphate decarboxylase [Candidatus Terasakiella magnetica]